METKDMYSNLRKGKRFSDEELMVGINHFKNLSDILAISGDEFYIPFRAANEAYITLRGYAIARGLIKL